MVIYLIFMLGFSSGFLFSAIWREFFKGETDGRYRGPEIWPANARLAVRRDEHEDLMQ